MKVSDTIGHTPTTWELRQFKNVQPWLYKRAIRLFGKERLEEWKDQIAEYWERQLEQIDEKQLLKALSRMYGRKQGKQLLRTSRSEKTRNILRGEEHYLVGRFAKKLANITQGPEDRFTTRGLKLEEHPYSTATVLHEGHEYTVDVDGLICITGTVTAYHPDGSQTQANIFSRWITHPFWQYTHLAAHCPASKKNREQQSA